ncbi:hypothetical protein [Halobacillus sp. Nhm2S1]|uniref:hypothetical protein n=1 Tax=Halobacillus sp. Nhm2S1 TaxID=2866716 RepID=UPI001C73379B|nr:hypothetical protein [Halobacillus sp. Nhm2S1]MBX0359165.1 hypothetical protein [Halobacillus sp. Nhm2S1]
MDNLKGEAVEYLADMLHEYKESKDKDFLEVNVASLRLISMLEEVIYFSKRTSALESFEPNYEQLGHVVINKFKEGNMKKRVMLDINGRGKEILRTIDE